MTNSDRTYDMKAERIVIDFLDKTLFPYVLDNYQLTDNIADQLSGSDVKFSLESIKDSIMDEKCALKYTKTNLAQSSLPTFAQEISFMRKDIWTKGWLFDKNKKTEYYLYCWLWAKKERAFSIDEITKIEAYLVKREDVIEYLKLCGIDEEKAFEIDTKIRERNIWGKYLEEKSSKHGLKFFFSNQLAEKPINIIINKTALKQLSIKAWKVAMSGPIAEIYVWKKPEQNYCILSSQTVALTGDLSV